MEVDVSRRATGRLSGTEYKVHLNFKNDIDSQPPRKPPFLTRVDGRLGHRHRTTQDAIPVKLAGSHHIFPCLPNGNPCLGSCTPKETWRPCFPPRAPASGKQTLTSDRIGSTWNPFPHEASRKRGQDPRLNDVRKFLQAVKDGACVPRAGKLTDYGGSLMFPADRIREDGPVLRSEGKNVGDIVQNFRLRPGDVFVLPCVNPKYVRLNFRGYVGFVQNSKCLNFEAGTLLLRVFKVRDSCLRTRQRVKLFLVTIDGRWRLKGSLESCGNLQDPCPVSNYRQIPVRHGPPLRPNTSDLQCIPQRGDLIIRKPWKDLHPCRKDRNGCLSWWRPKLELDVNDILLRPCVWSCCGRFEGFVHLYYYNGKGIRWVFLGRDETIFEPETVVRDSDSSDDDDERCSRDDILESYSGGLPCTSPCDADWLPRDPKNMPGCTLSDFEPALSCR